MAVIQRLPEGLVRKIAAGEVIERPASVVKELLENALDAGAHRVRVEAVEGGRQGIRVVDDGCGMGPEDVELSVERHATSKMRSPTDLYTVGTLGFRGEALASIGAVSRLTIETRTAPAEAGTRLVVEGGILRELGPVARDVGTTVDVQGLFYNTPARRKFMRHPESELRYLTQTVAQLAAAWPEVAFHLRHGDRTSLDLPAAERHLRAAEVLAVDAEELLWAAWGGAADRGPEAIRIEGVVTRPGRSRRSRSRQHVIVSRRPVQSPTLAKAVATGFGSLLPHGSHPQFVLWIDIDPRQVDVNVHPTKRQVRFADEARVRAAVQAAVRDALNVPEARVYSGGQTEGAVGEAGHPGRPGADTLAHGETEGIDTSADARMLWAPCASRRDARPEDPRWVVSDAADAGLTVAADSIPRGEQEVDGEGERSQLSLDLLPATSPAGAVVADDEEGRRLVSSAAAQHTRGRVWQIHDKYLLLPIRDGLLVVDQHVAHERIRYEEVVDALFGEPVASQQLLMPLTLEVTAVEMAAWHTSAQLFEQLGFGIREFGPASLLVDAVPPELRTWSDGALFHQILSDLIDELETRSEAREALAATMACHTSIRAGQRLAPEEMETLVSRLLKTREPFSCPHGRPVLLRIPLEEIDRLFHRT